MVRTAQALPSGVPIPLQISKNQKKGKELAYALLYTLYRYQHKQYYQFAIWMNSSDLACIHGGWDAKIRGCHGLFCAAVTRCLMLRTFRSKRGVFSPEFGRLEILDQAVLCVCLWGGSSG